MWPGWYSAPCPVFRLYESFVQPGWYSAPCPVFRLCRMFHSSETGTGRAGRVSTVSPSRSTWWCLCTQLGKREGGGGQKGDVKQRLTGAAAAEQPRSLARCQRALPCPWFWSPFCHPLPPSLLQLSGGSMGPISRLPLLLMATSILEWKFETPPLGITSPPCLLFSRWAFGILMRDGSQKDRILFFVREHTSRDLSEGLYSQVLGPQFLCSAFFYLPRSLILQLSGPSRHCKFLNTGTACIW